jgi:hypothetical protein
MFIRRVSNLETQHKIAEKYGREDEDGRPRDLNHRPSKCESDTKFLYVTVLESYHVAVQQQSLAQTFYIWSPQRTPRTSRDALWKHP